MRVDADAYSLDQYRAAGLPRFAEQWTIWRAVALDGLPGSWCATRRDANPGQSATVIRDTAAGLAAALEEVDQADTDTAVRSAW
jgi:hypothetical protein